MCRFVLAMMPLAQFYGGLAIALTVVIVGLAFFLGRKPDLGWPQLLWLCVLTLLFGPLAGAGLALVMTRFGDVNALDKGWLASSCLIVGTVAGAIVAALMGMIGAIRIMARGSSSKLADAGAAASPHGSSSPKDMVN